MPNKRKDNKGRLLRTGESQRKDLTYMYRYTDMRGKRQCVYADDLNKLREKEKKIQLDTLQGLDISGGGITVLELVERYVGLRRNVRYNTTVGYNFVLNILRKEEFGYQQVSKVRVVDAKRFLLNLYDKGRGYSSINSIKGVLKPAFQMAVNDDYLRKNPFDFKMDLIPNNSQKRVAMTEEEQERYLEYVRNDEHFSRYYDEIIVLLGTGMRISEFMGLTFSDLDFEERKIKVDHQLTRTRNGKYYVEKTKTENGVRFIYMTDEVKEALLNIIASRQKPRKEMVVDGYKGFLLLDKDGKPKVAMHLEHVMKRLLDKYNATHEEQLPRITPHVLRHTFCTRMAERGMNPKTLQYLMGHADITVTLNVYTHASYTKVADEMAQITAV